MKRITLENSKQVLFNVHSETVCFGRPCVIHNRTDHHMRSFPQYFREDTGVMERICSHQVGHPDPDNPYPDGVWQWVHGCDGCCKEVK